MKAASIYNLNQTLGQTTNSVKVIGEADASRFGFFAIVITSFNTLKNRIQKRYTLEAYELDQDGYPNMIDCLHFKNLAQLKKAFNSYTIE